MDIGCMRQYQQFASLSVQYTLKTYLQEAQLSQIGRALLFIVET